MRRINRDFDFYILNNCDIKHFYVKTKKGNNMNLLQSLENNPITLTPNKKYLISAYENSNERMFTIDDSIDLTTISINLMGEIFKDNDNDKNQYIQYMKHFEFKPNYRLTSEQISNAKNGVFNQLEINFIDNFKIGVEGKDNLALFIKKLSASNLEPTLASIYFREEDIEKLNFTSINSDEYFILFPKRIVRKNLDFDFYIE